MVRDIRATTVRQKQSWQNFFPYTNAGESVFTVAVGTYDRTHGYTAGFRKSQTQPENLPVIPMRLVKTTSTALQFDSVRMYPDGTITGETFGQSSNELLAAWGTSDIPADIVSAAEQKAITRFRSNSVGLKTELGIMLAESRKSADMIAHRAVASLGAVRSLVRGDITGVVRWLGLDSVAYGDRKRVQRARNKAAAKDIAGAWLELQYGWKPLLHDIHDSLKILEQTFAGGRPLAKVRGSSGTMRYTKDLGETNPGITRSGGFSATISVKYGGVVRVQDPGSYTLQSLGVTNPALVAWELVPYSFVIDWILPVGNYLEHLNELDGLDLFRGYRIERRTSLSRSRFSLTPAPYEYTLLTGGTPYRQTTGFVHDVQKVPTFPTDATTDWPPKVKGWLEGTKSPLTRIFNALALASNALLRR